MMKKTEQQRVIQGLLDHLDASTNVDAGGQVKIPVSTYLCPERAQQEWDLFFQDYPSILGLAADLPEAGTFFTNTDLGKPILCTRDNEGRFHAFLNVCRHRGVVVEASASGKKQTFSCPFHAWTYSNQGELVALPREDHFGRWINLVMVWCVCRPKKSMACCSSTRARTAPLTWTSVWVNWVLSLSPGILADLSVAVQSPIPMP